MKISIKKILVPTDFSDLSYTSLEYAVQIAKKTNAKITILHVYESMNHTNSNNQIMNYAELLEKGIKDKMKELVNENSKLWGVKIDSKVLQGKSYQVINELSKTEGFDLVVMATHGATSVKNISKFILGTNAYRVVHESACPVITIRKTKTNIEFNNILVPLDVTKDSNTKADFVIEWAKLFKAKVHLVAVTELLDEFISDINALNEIVNNLEARLQKEGIPYTNKMFRNSPLGKTVMMHAKKMNCDMIMIMSRKDSTFGEFLIPSADRRVIGESEIPVLSLRPKA
jgi:nucleotide-binding universal stress UspA family protein